MGSKISGNLRHLWIRKAFVAFVAFVFFVFFNPCVSVLSAFSGELKAEKKPKTEKTRSTRSTCPQAAGATSEMARKIRQFRPSAFPAAPCKANQNLSANPSAFAPTCPHRGKALLLYLAGEDILGQAVWDGTDGSYTLQREE